MGGRSGSAHWLPSRSRSASTTYGGAESAVCTPPVAKSTYPKNKFLSLNHEFLKNCNKACGLPVVLSPASHFRPCGLAPRNIWNPVLQHCFGLAIIGPYWHPPLIVKERNEPFESQAQRDSHPW